MSPHLNEFLFLFSTVIKLICNLPFNLINRTGNRKHNVGSVTFPINAFVLDV